MREVVIVNPVRTPVGSHGGALRSKRAQDLAEIVFRAVLEQTGLDPAVLDEVILGNIGQPSDAANVARVAALMAGVPIEVPAFTVQRNCASGIQSITSAYQAIQAGDGEIYLCGGTESMSNIPYILKKARWGYKLRHAELTDALWEGLTDPICGQIMGRTAENLAEKYDISREEQDKFAVQSHKKAFMAQRMGKFDDEIVPVEIVKRVAGQEVAREKIVHDETINPGLTVQKAALYPTVFKENGTVTPANACPISDGAAAMIVCTAEKAEELGLKPTARIVSYAYAAVDPAYMGIGPAFAMPKALERAGLSLDDIGLIELNEAFAAQCLAVEKEMKAQGHNWDWDKVNVNGGAIALGHPVGCTAAKLVATLTHEMQRREVRYGMDTMCVGGGQGGALIVERVGW
ncbi:MAG: acetyl-CoA C-acyltransferase [Chloroflexi bacterium]|nr:MAG: acetyl-CoA C-acyltransferase [Chloroflexota bacterium]